MRSCPRCSSCDLTRDGHDQRGRVVYACAGCGRQATTESLSLISGHRFPRDVILLAVRYYLQLGAAAERIAGLLADRGIDVSGRTILRWVQKFGPALATEVQRHRRAVAMTWLVDETYVKILGKWHYLYRGIDLDGQVLDCWLSATRDLPAAEAFFRRTIGSTGCVPRHVQGWAAGHAGQDNAAPSRQEAPAAYSGRRIWRHRLSGELAARPVLVAKLIH